MKVIACYSNKGGVGKTASSVNLAYWAARSGHKTLLIDLDPQGASSYYFRVRPSQKNWGKRFLKAYGLVFEQIKASDFENLDVVPAQRSFRHFDTRLSALAKRLSNYGKYTSRVCIGFPCRRRLAGRDNMLRAASPERGPRHARAGPFHHRRVRIGRSAEIRPTTDVQRVQRCQLGRP